MLFELGLKLTILKMSSKIFAWHYTESVAAQADNFPDAFVSKSLAHGYYVVATI